MKTNLNFHPVRTSIINELLNKVIVEIRQKVNGKWENLKNI